MRHRWRVFVLILSNVGQDLSWPPQLPGQVLTYPRIQL
jgi:hypothetical protein